jgi:hypothetical protein
VGLAACFLAAVDHVNHGTDQLQVALCGPQQLRVLYKSVQIDAVPVKLEKVVPAWLQQLMGGRRDLHGNCQRKTGTKARI